jgi:NitT/TauT family transport system substrate-binding protein
MRAEPLFFRIFVCLFLCLIPVSGFTASAVRSVTFLPHWSPQAQFAGYYVAHEKGIYSKYGIDVNILTGGAHIQASEYLESEKVGFVTMWLSAAVQRRSQGVKLVNIGQVMQRSALMLLARKTSRIERPQDMDGKKIGLWGGDFAIQPKAFFKRHKVNPRIIAQSFSVNLFLRGGVDVASAMWYNEYHTILNSGVDASELTPFFFHELGLNFPEDGIYVLEKTLKQDPDLACRFVAASLEGWRYAFTHQEEAVDIVLEYAARARVPANRVHQKWMLARMQELTIPEKGNDIPLGGLKQTDFQNVGRELKEAGLIPGIPDFNLFYKGCVGAEK